MSFSSRQQIANEILRIAKELTAAPQYTYNDVKKLAIKYGSLMDDLYFYGIEDEFSNGYAIHHFGNTTHEIERKRGNGAIEHYTKICQTFNGERIDYPYLMTLENELEHIVLLPIWFHNYLHGKHIKFNSKNKYYELLEKMLTSEETYSDIKALAFDASSVKKALNSVEKLLIIPKALSRRNEIINRLRTTFEDIKQDIISYLSPYLKS